MSSIESERLVDHLFRTRAGQMVAWLTRAFGAAHLELAEEVVQDALVKALQLWPHSGVPDNPTAWLMRVARNGALDVLRRNIAFADRAHAIEAELTRGHGGTHDAPHAIADDELRLIFMCCHPSLSPEARVALSLQLAGGFSAREIARALLAPEAAVAQRLVRAKRQLREANAALEMPSDPDLPARLGTVLDVIYLMFNEGYAAQAGDALIRADVCREALRLGRALAAAPRTATPETHALVALMAFQAARFDARVDDRGDLVRLEDQDRSKWDARLTALGFHHFEASTEGPRMSAYHVQAAIASLHAMAPSAGETPWRTILARYDQLLALVPSAVTELNRAVALSKVEGPRAALGALARIEHAPELARYYLLWSVKAQLLDEAGDAAAARACYARALTCPCSEPERRFLTMKMGTDPISKTGSVPIS